MAISEDAVKSEKPISCSHMVKNTIPFQGVDPTIPYNRKSQFNCWLSTNNEGNFDWLGDLGRIFQTKHGLAGHPNSNCKHLSAFIKGENEI